MVDIYLEYKDEERGHALTRQKKLEYFLRYVGDTGFQINVGETMSINQISRLRGRVVRVLCSYSVLLVW